MNNINNDENSQNTNSHNGLNGLGSLDSRALSFESSAFETDNVDTNCLVVDQSKFNTLDSYYIYLRKWFSDTGIVGVQDISYSVRNSLSYPYMFDIAFSGNNDETHAVIACLDIGTAKQFLTNCRNGRFSTTALMFCFYNFNESDKRIAMNNNIELVGISEMYDLNNAMTSVFGGLTLGTSVIGKMQKALREKFKGQNAPTKALQNSVNNAGDELMHSISDGFDQLKGSIVTMLSSIGVGKVANTVNNFSNPFEHNVHTATVEKEQSQNDDEHINTNIPMGKVYGTQVDLSKQVDKSQDTIKSVVTLAKESNQNIELSRESTVGQGMTDSNNENEVSKQGVSLTKTETAVETTDNVVVKNNNEVITAEDFLKIN